MIRERKIMTEVLKLQITVFLLVVVGFLIKRIKLVDSKGQAAITDLVIYVVLPANILKAFMVKFEDGMGRELIVMLVISILIQVLSVFYGRFMYRKQSEGRRKCLEYGTICSNSGFLGNPIAEGIYGAYGLVLASVFLIPLRIMMWTSGIAAFSGTSDKKKTLIRTATHPCIVACAIGLVLMLTGLRFPEPVTKSLTYLGQCNTALSMLVIGMILTDINVKTLFDKTVVLYTVHRLVILPLIVFAAVYFLPVSGIVKGVAVILTAMPAGATTSILAAKYEMEPEFATKMVIFSTLLSLPTLCLWSMVLGMVF